MKSRSLREGRRSGCSLLPFILKELWSWVNLSPSSKRLPLLTQPLLCLIMTLGTSKVPEAEVHIPCIIGCHGQGKKTGSLNGTSQQLVLPITEELLLTRPILKVIESWPVSKAHAFYFYANHLHSPKELLSHAEGSTGNMATMPFERS